MSEDALEELLLAVDFEGDKAWPLIVEFVADWIETQGQVHHKILAVEASALAADWREEMMR